MKVVSIVGTRPNFCNKELVINKELKKSGIEEILVHTGQHYDYNLSKIFFEQLGLPEPDYHLSLSSTNGTKQISEMLIGISDILKNETPHVTLVYGDVTSTLAAAIASVKMKIPVAHVEAGIRVDNIYNPEEINRRVSDVLSEILFAPVDSAYQNLLKENFPPSNIFYTGDVVCDSIMYMVNNFGIKTTNNNNYILTTIHREENVTNKKRLTEIINGLINSDEDVIFPAHPRTLSMLKEYGLYQKVICSRIKLMEPCGYLEFLNLLANCRKIVTDSGGVRREAYIMGKPVIVPITMQWFPEIFESGWGIITDANAAKIANAIKDFSPISARPSIFGDGHASEKIVEILKQRYEM